MVIPNLAKSRGFVHDIVAGKRTLKFKKVFHTSGSAIITLKFESYNANISSEPLCQGFVASIYNNKNFGLKA
jgi:hypothetical protein